MFDFTHPYQPDPRVILDTSNGGHRWTLDGQPCPGITSILTDSGWIGEWGATEEQKQDGHNLHVAIALSVDGSLDEEHFREKWPHLVGKLEAGRRALEFFKVRQGWVEIPVCHRRLWYATAIDAVGQLEDAIIVLNWKSGERVAWHSLQSAGEHLALFDDWCDLEGKTARIAVHLQADGTFDFVRDCVVHADQRDFALFEAACITAEGKKRKGVARPEPKSRKAREEKRIEPVESKVFEATTKAQDATGLFG